MRLKAVRLCSDAAGIGAALLLAAGVAAWHAPRAQAASGLFANLSGSWSGTGTIKTASGTEPIRCRATYVVENGDNTLEQSLKCASDSYRFEVESSVTYNEGAGLVKGMWKETTNNVGGRVSGPAGPGRITARVEGNAFSADLELLTKGDSQSVTIRPENTDITEVFVDLRKR